MRSSVSTPAAPRARWIAAVGLLTGFLLLGSYREALAHLGLRASTPARGATLAEAPRELRLTFTQGVTLALARVTLLSPDSQPVALAVLRRGEGADSARVVIAPIVGPLVAGRYSVRWEAASADGHPVRGQFAFSIAPGAAGLAPVVPPDRTATDSTAAQPPALTVEPAPARAPMAVTEEDELGVQSPLYVAIRWLGYLALLGAVGVVGFRMAVLPSAMRRAPDALAPAAGVLARRAAATGALLALALLIAVVLRLVAQSLAFNGAADALDVARIRTLLAGTIWGTGWLLALAGSLVAVSGFAAARSGRGGWRAAAAGTAVAVLAQPLMGHAVAGERLVAAAVVADALHVLGAAGWLGTLLVLVAVGIPVAIRAGGDARGPLVAALVYAFSPVALASAGVLLATGVLASWLHLGSLSALWGSAYGRTLLVKLAVLAIVVAIGAYNWQRIRPSLGDEPGIARIRRSATTELVIGALVLAVTAVLVATPPAAEERAATAALQAH